MELNVIALIGIILLIGIVKKNAIMMIDFSLDAERHGGKSPEEYKGVAKFLAFLSDTNRQVEVHKASGYLPITKAAYEKAKEDGFYKEQPYLETPLKELTNKEPTENSRGLRLGNMVQLRDMWAEEIEQALAGKKTAKQALDAAVERGNQMLRQFEKTAVR